MKRFGKLLLIHKVHKVHKVLEVMREKKNYTIITFHTTTEAMAMEKKCHASHIPGRLIPVPKEITAGCGLAWRMEVDEYTQYQGELQQLSLKFEQITEGMMF